MTGRRIRVAIALLAVIAGCARTREPARPALVPSGSNVGTWGFAPWPNEVMAVGGTPLHVLRPVTLESATLLMKTGELEVLDFRVSLFACRECRRRPDALVGFAGHAGSVCSRGSWPPKGYGPSYPLSGFELAPGDRPSLLVYVRARTATALSDGVVIRYRENGTVAETHITSDLIEVKPRAPGALGDQCTEGLWFGGTRDPATKLITSLGPTPPA